MYRSYRTTNNPIKSKYRNPEVMKSYEPVKYLHLIFAGNGYPMAIVATSREIAAVLGDRMKEVE